MYMNQWLVDYVLNNFPFTFACYDSTEKQLNCAYHLQVLRQAINHGVFPEYIKAKSFHLFPQTIQKATCFFKVLYLFAKSKLS